ncbi:Uncharacterised protein [Zhongshania aliphaticivorans]|uniref:Uncharacterized protein n=1 Tax=Zhongshania aliphaticivorans TaxID=1470434 RepID=A0A5S9NC12_9GAMM|nr:hypothetical protein [Zhongshania aliphaticivorans]CAA0078224.1 Uncharacterised protein [Zhongshania aliphaticivorans]CAA0086864.1 Uncharacterised protein [Zhongshania aliphaticivorans]
MKAHTIASVVIIILLFSVCSTAQIRDFSTAHKKIERALEGRAGFPGSDAIWVAHNVLGITVIKDVINEKKYAKDVCNFLAENGFSSQKVTVNIVDQNELRSYNRWSQLASVQCKN